jgi:hypothetical protein
MASAPSRSAIVRATRMTCARPRALMRRRLWAHTRSWEASSVIGHVDGNVPSFMHALQRVASLPKRPRWIALARATRSRSL